jgi:hypothetical protein
MRTRHPRPAPVPRSAFAGFRFPPDVIVLAARYGVGTSTVRRWLADAGIPRRLPGRPSQAPDREELARLYLAERLSTTQIGERYGVRQQTALRWLRVAEVALRPQGQPTRARTPRQPEQ